MSKIPDSIFINPYDYDIRFVDELKNDDGHDLYGRIDYPDLTIRLAEKYKDGQRMPVMLWHELLHGILEAAGTQEDGEEVERVIRALSPGIVAILRDNDWVRDL